MPLLKNWCFWTVVLEKTLEIQPVHSEGDQPWDFFGGNDAKAETPVFWPPHVKSWLIGKNSNAGRDWGQEKGTTEDEMAGWHHLLDGHESEWTPGVGDEQGGQVHGVAKSQTWLGDWTELNWSISLRNMEGHTRRNSWKFQVGLRCEEIWIKGLLFSI